MTELPFYKKKKKGEKEIEVITLFQVGQGCQTKFKKKIPNLFGATGHYSEL